MTATFVFKLGTLDLSAYVRVNPDDSMDPYGQPWLQPAFTETPFADGQPLISTTVGNREQMWPLFLSDSSRLKDQLHKLIQSIQIAQGQKPLTVEWRDDGASASTFFDVAFLRFEPNFNFRRSQHGYGAGTLHVWVAGYGHTGTLRIAGTAAGTGVFLSVPMPSVGGDSPALLDSTITAGANLPTYGRIVALAPISHPSYTALVPAASLVEPQAGATLVGASGAQGSQYLALPVSPTGGASGVACFVPLQNPTIMGGDNRLLAVVKSGISGGVGIQALDPYGNAMGGTAVASMTAGMGIVDLGICRLPTVGLPTRPLVAIQAGGIWASGAEGPAILASPGLVINEIICLPDKNLTLLLENTGGGSQISKDTFPGIGALTGKTDAVGHPWAEGFNHTGDPLVGYINDVSGSINLSRSASSADSAHIAAILSDSMVIKTKGKLANGVGEVILMKESAAGVYTQAQLSASGFLAIAAATAGTLNLLASVAVASIPRVELRLSLQLQAGRAIANLTRDDGAAILVTGASSAFASVSASSIAVAPAGLPGLALGAPATFGGPGLTTWEVVTIPSSSLAPYDSYRIDGPNADSYRKASSGVFAGQKLVAMQRGAFPKAAPSTSSVAIVCAPFDQGAANDTISAVVTARERFFYAR